MTKEIVFNTSECDWKRRLQQMRESIETLRTELENRLRFETLLVEISAHFINLPADQIDSAVAELAPAKRDRNAQNQKGDCRGVVQGNRREIAWRTLARE